MFNKVKGWVQESHELLKEYLSSDPDYSSKKKLTRLSLDEHRYPSFTQLLPYQYFDEESRVFFNEHNAGLIYRIIPLTGANEQIAEQLDTLLRSKVSHDFTLQLLLVKHNQVGYEIDAFARQFSKVEFKNLSMLGDNLKTFYQNAAIHGFKTNTTISGLSHRFARG
jgi:conjugal transfer ATP-binding protein TraC